MLKKKKSLKKSKSLSVGAIGKNGEKEEDLAIDKSKKTYNSDTDSSESGGKKKPKKEDLWRKAKKLVKSESSANLAQNVLRLNRELKKMKTSKEKSNKEQNDLKTLDTLQDLD